MKSFITLTGVICCSLLPHVCHGEPDESADSSTENKAGTEARSGQLTVSGYEPAFEFLAKELSQRARKNDLLVVWLFDESASMPDDHKEIATALPKFHEEIHNALRSLDLDREDAVEYCVYSFGSRQSSILQSPSSDLELIRQSIRKIPIDESGKENTVQAIGSVILQNTKLAKKAERRLVLILATDESGDDTDNDKTLEMAVSLAQQELSPIYVLGREATFGLPDARLRWIDPKFRLTHWLRIRRGPESAQLESLQWDGMRARYDTQGSGFGPYGLVRLARESGGAYLILPREAQAGFVPNQAAQNQAPLPEEYRPSYESRASYLQQAEQSRFRATLLNIVQTLGPNTDDQLMIRENGYPMDKAEFKAEAEKQFPKIQHAHQLVEGALSGLEAVRVDREQKPSLRWQAHFDLMFAQLSTYRIRLQQTALALDRHLEFNPPAKNDKSNRWRLVRAPKLILPDEEQYARLQSLLKLTPTREAYVKQLQDDAVASRQLLQDVIDRHPDTPWASRARYELQLGFGMIFRDLLQPSFYRTKIEIPCF